MLLIRDNKLKFLLSATPNQHDSFFACAKDLCEFIELVRDNNTPCCVVANKEYELGDILPKLYLFAPPKDADRMHEIIGCQSINVVTDYVPYVRFFAE